MQESFLDYLSSDEYTDSLRKGFINILDIGSGPAVASLAIADMTNYLAAVKGIPNYIKYNFIMNDTSNICLGLAKELLNRYFIISKNYYKAFLKNEFYLNSCFPETISQINRITKQIGPLDFIIFSYVITPFEEQNVDIEQEINNLRQICNENAQILIIQDKYKEELMNQKLNATKKNSVTHKVYSKQNENDSFTYEYCQCLLPLSDAVA